MKGLKIEAGASREVTVLFLALNVFGYDDENNSRGMNVMRKRARKELKRSVFKNTYIYLHRAMRVYSPWTLLHTVISQKRRNSKNSRNFFTEFNRFSQEPVVRQLSQDVREIQLASAKILLPLLKQELQNFISLLGNPPKEVKKIVLIANPLDAYWRGYQVRENGTVYLVVGPGAKHDNGTLVRHELLHLFANRIQLPRSFIVHLSQRLIKQGYGSARVLKEEYIVRALDLFYRSVILKKDISQMLNREQRDLPRIREALTLVAQKIEKGRR